MLDGEPQGLRSHKGYGVVVLLLMSPGERHLREGRLLRAARSGRSRPRQRGVSPGRIDGQCELTSTQHKSQVSTYTHTRYMQLRSDTEQSKYPSYTHRDADKTKHRWAMLSLIPICTGQFKVMSLWSRWFGAKACVDVVVSRKVAVATLVYHW